MWHNNLKSVSGWEKCVKRMMCVHKCVKSADKDVEYVHLLNNKKKPTGRDGECYDPKQETQNSIYKIICILYRIYTHYEFIRVNVFPYVFEHVIYLFWHFFMGRSPWAGPGQAGPGPGPGLPWALGKCWGNFKKTCPGKNVYSAAANIREQYKLYEAFLKVPFCFHQCLHALEPRSHFPRSRVQQPGPYTIVMSTSERAN